MKNVFDQLGISLQIINGGGTGSLESTSSEQIVTEITVGSGFYAPTLFDQYTQFSQIPALSFFLTAVRKPQTDIITCLGGGHIASGMMGEDRLPTPVYPLGLKLLKYEGAGEVQTPLSHAQDVKIGDKIFFRHAKAGEICEHFNEIIVIKNNKISETLKTYRGEGQCFL
jgi:D-serine deaminase-like pyridoxal phosphate-dependent protein